MMKRKVGVGSAKERKIIGFEQWRGAVFNLGCWQTLKFWPKPKGG